MEIKIVGATAAYERRIREALVFVPSWFVSAARIARIEVSTRPDVREQIALFEHGSRVLFVSPNVGGLLQKAIIHELSHGVDDVFGQPHYFSSMDAWLRIHRAQGYFDIPKYRTEPLEYLADQLAKWWIWGSMKFRVTHPQEAHFIEKCVVPALYAQFSV
jgi:hypothetical protein